MCVCVCVCVCVLIKLSALVALLDVHALGRNLNWKLEHAQWTCC